MRLIGKRKYKFMNREEFNYILKEVKPFTNHIYFHLMGEPLLNENIEAFLEDSYENELMVNLTTNGTLLNKVGEKLIKAKALRQINISLHSFEANESKIELHEYINNVTDFINNATEKSNIICAIRLWNMDNKELKGFSEEDILSAGLAAYDVELGEDEYFVMGDNCNNSEDSRVSNIGNIKRSQFVGKIAGTLHKVTRQ